MSDILLVLTRFLLLCSSEILTLIYTLLKQESYDTVNCGVFCCVVAISAILDVEVPEDILPNFWRRGLLELIGGKADELHSDFDCLHDPHSWNSPEIFRQQQLFVETMRDYRNKIVTANSEAMKTVEKNLVSMRDEFAKFYLTLRFSDSEIERLRKVTKDRSSGLDNMLSRMTDDIEVVQGCWNSAGSTAWLG